MKCWRSSIRFLSDKCILDTVVKDIIYFLSEKATQIMLFAIKHSRNISPIVISRFYFLIMYKLVSQSGPVLSGKISQPEIIVFITWKTLSKH